MGKTSKWHHPASATPSHLQQWSPPRWLGAARQWTLCQWNFRLRDWTPSCHLLLHQNQARSSPTPDENQRTSSCCQNDRRRNLRLQTRTHSLYSVRWIIALIDNNAGQDCKSYRTRPRQANLFASLKTCTDAFVTYDDVETSQIFCGKFSICLPTQASWW